MTNYNTRTQLKIECNENESQKYLKEETELPQLGRLESKEFEYIFFLVGKRKGNKLQLNDMVKGRQ